LRALDAERDAIDGFHVGDLRWKMMRRKPEVTAVLHFDECSPSLPARWRVGTSLLRQLAVLYAIGLQQAA